MYIVMLSQLNEYCACERKIIHDDHIVKIGFRKSKIKVHKREKIEKKTAHHIYLSLRNVANM